MDASRQIHHDEQRALLGKVMLITGGASGLGRDVAFQAGERGAKVALFDVRADRLAEAKASLDAEGVACLTFAGDVAEEVDVSMAIGAVVKEWGRLDIAINSAGIYRGGLLVDLPMAEYDAMFRVNVRGTYLVCKEAAKVMVAQKGGHIFNVASIGAKNVFPEEIAYSATKWAVVGISEGISRELGRHNIRVTTIYPGGMNTTFWELNKPTRGVWDPTGLMKSSRVAQAIIQIASLPEDAVVKEAQVYPPGF
jgi:NADP-dependent 3-hydroxy acid dehydrogenase YdfG